MRNGLMVACSAVLVWPASLLAQSGVLQGVVLGGIVRDASGAVRHGGDPLAAGQELQADRDPASFYLWAGSDQSPSAEGIVRLAAGARAGLIGPAEGIQIVELVSGSMVVQYQSTGAEPLIVRVAPRGVPWVRLVRGTLWLSVGAAGPQIALAEKGGEATRFDEPMPDAGPQAAAGGKPVPYEAGANASAQALAAAVEQASMQASAEDWLSRAERGDLLPNDPNVAQAQATVAQTPQVAVVRSEGQAVTQTPSSAVVQTPVSGTGAAGAQSTFSGVSALLVSGNPASVVVATRFERARVVGVSSTNGAAAFGTQSSFLGFNTQVRPPFSLSR